MFTSIAVEKLIMDWENKNMNTLSKKPCISNDEEGGVVVKTSVGVAAVVVVIVEINGGVV